MNKRYLGLRFPFTSKDEEGFYVDLEHNPYAEIKSDIMHLIFTPMGQRIRMPQFGTNLMKFIFEPKDGITLDEIKEELNKSIKKFIPSVNINTINITESEFGVETKNIQIDYTINEGYGILTEDTININI